MPRSAVWRARRHVDAAAAPSAAIGGAFPSIRSAYEACGTTDFYMSHGAEYSNPHEQVLAECMSTALCHWLPTLQLSEDAAVPWRVLDVACGSGEASLAFSAAIRGRVGALEVLACDPYTYTRYEERTGRSCHRWSFDELADGVLERTQPMAIDLVLASFCLHLLHPPSLHRTLAALARVSRWLLVATPHRKPAIDESTGWSLAAAEQTAHDLFDSGSKRHRVRLRLYCSGALAVHPSSTVRGLLHPDTS